MLEHHQLARGVQDAMDLGEPDRGIRHGAKDQTPSSSRKRQVTDHASTDAVRDIENLLANQAAHVEKMRKASDGIRKHNDVIRKELDRAEIELKELIGKAQETLRALDFNAGSESAEREEPIAFDDDDNDSSQVA